MPGKRDKYLIQGVSLSVFMALFSGIVADSAKATYYNSYTELQKHLAAPSQLPQIAPVADISAAPWQLRTPVENGDEENADEPLIVSQAPDPAPVSASSEKFDESFRAAANLSANYLSNNDDVDYSLKLENYMQYAADESAVESDAISIASLFDGLVESFRVVANLPTDYLKTSGVVDYSVKLENYMQYAANDTIKADDFQLAQATPKRIAAAPITIALQPAHIPLPETAITPETIAAKMLADAAKNSTQLASAQPLMQSIKIEMLANTDSSPVPVVTSQTLQPLLPPVPQLPSNPKLQVPAENPVPAAYAPVQAQAPTAAATPAPASTAQLFVPPSKTPSATITSVASPAAQDSGLPAADKAILSKLPPEKTKAAKKTEPIDIEHARNNAVEDVEKSHKGVGIEISLKRPKADITRMLESAYDNLIEGNQENAIALYKQVLSVDPKNKLALFGLATTYHRAGQLQVARALYGQLLAIDPHNVEGLNNYLVLLADEDPKDALVELDKLQKSHPGLSVIPAQMGIIYEKTGNYDMAAKKMDEAINLTPENLKYRYDMAVILDKKGDWPDAALLYRQLLTASARGEKIAATPEAIQQRLTFILTNRPKG